MVPFEPSPPESSLLRSSPAQAVTPAKESVNVAAVRIRRSRIDAAFCVPRRSATRVRSFAAAHSTLQHSGNNFEDQGDDSHHDRPAEALGVVAVEEPAGDHVAQAGPRDQGRDRGSRPDLHQRSEEHTSELQSLMRISYAVFCLKQKKTKN